jgi:hypothetical protein
LSWKVAFGEPWQTADVTRERTHSSPETARTIDGEAKRYLVPARETPATSLSPTGDTTIDNSIPRAYACRKRHPFASHMLLGMNDPVAGIRELFADAARKLELAAAKDELLVQLTQRRRVLVLARSPVMVPLGRVWRLGVFLLGRDVSVYATGSITRVTDTTRPTYQSLSVEERRAYRMMAVRSGLPRDETVNFNATPIELDAAQLRTAIGPLFLRDDEPFVRWSQNRTDDSAPRLDSYLRDRVELLADPPDGT